MKFTIAGKAFASALAAQLPVAVLADKTPGWGGVGVLAPRAAEVLFYATDRCALVTESVSADVGDPEGEVLLPVFAVRTLIPALRRTRGDVTFEATDDQWSVTLAGVPLAAGAFHTNPSLNLNRLQRVAGMDPPQHDGGPVGLAGPTVEVLGRVERELRKASGKHPLVFDFREGRVRVTHPARPFFLFQAATTPVG